jgi:hypothetical protein
MLEYLKAPKGFEEIEEAYSLYERQAHKDESPILLDREFLAGLLGRYSLQEDKVKRIYGALDEVEGNPQLLELYKFLRWDLCRYKKGIDGWFYQNFDFEYESEFPDCRKFVLLLSCIPEGRKDLIRRKVPAEIYEPMPHKIMAPLLEKYERTGNCEVTDFSWDKNFYTGTIFLFDRFYFTPYTFNDPFSLYRDMVTGKVTGIYGEGYRVDNEGQVIPADKVGEVESSFATTLTVTDKTVTGNYINPCGIISATGKTLSTIICARVLKPGDLLLAFHIPGGEGYNPQRLEKSMSMALSFYDNFFGELEIKGFWSESWLYDPKLSLLLDRDSNIVAMQRRFYCYPIGEGQDMLLKELKPYSVPEEERTSLQRKAAFLMDKKVPFHSTSMIVLREDVKGIADDYTYVNENDIKEFRAVLLKAGINIPELLEEET